MVGFGGWQEMVDQTRWMGTYLIDLSRHMCNEAGRLTLQSRILVESDDSSVNPSVDRWSASSGVAVQHWKRFSASTNVWSKRTGDHVSPSNTRKT